MKDQSHRIKIMTYNIRLGIETSLAEVAAAIAAAGPPDLVALQEVGDHWRMGERVDQTGAIAAAIGFEHATFAGALIDEAGGRFGVALLARWPLDDVGIERLPQVKDEQRVLLSARLSAPFGAVTVLCTHLSVEAGERVEQARIIASRASAHSGPLLLLGDLNDLPESETLGALSAPGLEWLDLYDHAGEGPPETFSVRDPNRRIDYLLVSGGLRPAGRCRVLRQAHASDHFPLAGEVAFG